MSLNWCICGVPSAGNHYENKPGLIVSVSDYITRTAHTRTAHTRTHTRERHTPNTHTMDSEHLDSTWWNIKIKVVSDGFKIQMFCLYNMFDYRTVKKWKSRP